MARAIKIDGKVRTDKKYPAGFMGEFLGKNTRCRFVGCIEAGNVPSLETLITDPVKIKAKRIDISLRRTYILIDSMS